MSTRSIRHASAKGLRNAPKTSGSDVVVPVDVCESAFNPSRIYSEKYSHEGGVPVDRQFAEGAQR